MGGPSQPLTAVFFFLWLFQRKGTIAKEHKGVRNPNPTESQSGNVKENKLTSSLVSLEVPLFKHK